MQRVLYKGIISKTPKAHIYTSAPDFHSSHPSDRLTMIFAPARGDPTGERLGANLIYDYNAYIYIYIPTPIIIIYTLIMLIYINYYIGMLSKYEEIALLHTGHSDVLGV